MAHSSAPSRIDLTPEAAHRMLEEAEQRYFRSRHEQVEAFVQKHFSLSGSAAIHRKALGWDVLKAPANIALAVPNLSLKLAASAAKLIGAQGLAQSLSRCDLLLKTAVGREFEWLIVTELLELPHTQRGRESRKDALAETILAAPDVQVLLREALQAVGRRGDDPEFRRQLEEAMTTYVGTRAAASEITTALITLGAGSVAVHQVTPGMISFGPALAAVMAHNAAVASFPLGATLGGLWCSAVPVAASPALAAGLTGGLMGIAAMAAAFAGIIADPVQRRLGIHQRRLHRLIDALERQVREGGTESGLVLRDHYVARLLDLMDLVSSAYRIAKGKRTGPARYGSRWTCPTARGVSCSRRIGRIFERCPFGCAFIADGLLDCPMCAAPDPVFWASALSSDAERWRGTRSPADAAGLIWHI
jgi:hypothetical protein